MSESEQRVHGGNLRRLSEESGLPAEEILDFSASINPLGPPPWLRQVVNRHLGDVQHYPDPESTELVSAIAAAHELDPACVVAANGTTEIIYHLPRALDVHHAVVVDPSYADYRRASELGSLEVHSVPLERPEHGGAVDLHARFQLDLDAVTRAVDRCGGPAIVWLGRP
ncbi:MAG: aminotransferase class I/II-fold pyridoxal phosphate-dependent enzyme, partial [Spirochaetaceae bacterium]|nr:aminotransferase class I/II-fold pyridoxal phosphate-dependent enzyme [Spirochaetaceae bacterium]